MWKGRPLLCRSLLLPVLCSCFQVLPRPSLPNHVKSCSQITSPLKAEAEQRQSSITGWVVENLEDSNSTITTRSTVQAGENDTLPIEGLLVGNKFRILAADAPIIASNSRVPIRLYLGRNGWGTGVHPSTRLCLEWLESLQQQSEDDTDDKAVLLDYGCGSGILSIAAMQLGVAQSCIGVDVEAEALVTAERNVELNGLLLADDGTTTCFDPYHTREILPYMFQADLCVANILIGQLVRPSMVAAIVSNVKAGGLVCFSGIRPGEQVESLQQAYGDALEWVDATSLEAKDTEGSVASYGFDCGAWSRLVGRKKDDTGRRQAEIDAMSELAVS